MVVVDVCGSNAILERLESGLDPGRQVSVTGVKTDLDVFEARVIEKLDESFRRAELVRRIFEQNGYAALFGEDSQVFDGGERGVELSQVVLLAGDAEVKDQITKGEPLGDLDGALNFIHGIDAEPAFQMGHGDCQASGSFPVRIGGKGGVDRVQRDGVVAEPLRHIAHMVRIVIIQVPAGREELDVAEAGGENLIQDMGTETLAAEEVGGETVLH